LQANQLRGPTCEEGDGEEKGRKEDGRVDEGKEKEGRRRQQKHPVPSFFVYAPE